VVIVWPIWTKLLSLEAVRTVLGHPTLYREPPDRRVWDQLGVFEVRKSERVSLSKYYSAFKRARAV
jgi:hypothetical protein